MSGTGEQGPQSLLQRCLTAPPAGKLGEQGISSTPTAPGSLFTMRVLQRCPQGPGLTAHLPRARHSAQDLALEPLVVSPY